MEFAAARRGCVVVAHPDDESLWCGGLIVRYPIDWTIIACSVPRKDPVRAWHFYSACALLGAQGRVIPFSERELIRFDLLGDLSIFDVIVTHGAAGEYGHAQHKEVHAYVKEHWPQARCFGGKEILQLDAHEIERKRAAIQCYVTQPTLIEYFWNRCQLWRESYD